MGQEIQSIIYVREIYPDIFLKKIKIQHTSQYLIRKNREKTGAISKSLRSLARLITQIKQLSRQDYKKDKEPDQAGP